MKAFYYIICEKTVILFRPQYVIVKGNRHRGLEHAKKTHETPNRLVSQMLAPLEACSEPAGKLWQLCKVLYVLEHKTQYILIHAPFTRIVIFWHIGYVPPMIS